MGSALSVLLGVLGLRGTSTGTAAVGPFVARRVNSAGQPYHKRYYAQRHRRRRGHITRQARVPEYRNRLPREHQRTVSRSRGRSRVHENGNKRRGRSSGSRHLANEHTRRDIEGRRSKSRSRNISRSRGRSSRRDGGTTTNPNQVPFEHRDTPQARKVNFANSRTDTTQPQSNNHSSTKAGAHNDHQQKPDAGPQNGSASTKAGTQDTTTPPIAGSQNKPVPSAGAGVQHPPTPPPRDDIRRVAEWCRKYGRQNPYGLPPPGGGVLPAPPAVNASDEAFANWKTACGQT